jgi:hypothetical protein
VAVRSLRSSSSSARIANALCVRERVLDAMGWGVTGFDGVEIVDRDLRVIVVHAS